MKPFKLANLLLLLCVLGATQSACTMFRKDVDQGAHLPALDEEVLYQYPMAGFRFDIPAPEERLTLLPDGFSLQSFVERLFADEKERSPAPSDSVDPLARLSLPEPAVPGTQTRSHLQTRFCEKIDQRLSSIGYDECMAVALQATGHLSTQGQPILQGQFGAFRGTEPTGRVLLIGGIHGDELSSVSIVFEWMQFLQQHHDGTFVWNVVPVMNPDGLFRDKPTRTNANGVDLNRNMPSSDWQSKALAYWRSQAESSPRKFPGHNAASEAETQWLIAEIDRFQPDMIITVHAPHNLIDYDAPTRENAPRKFGHVKGNLLGTYPGSLGNYAGVKRGIPVVTIELPSANTATSVAQAQLMWSDMLEWLEKTIPLENQRFLKNREYARVRSS